MSSKLSILSKAESFFDSGYTFFAKMQKKKYNRCVEDGEMALNIGGILMLKAAAEAENSSKNVSVSNIWRILAGASYT